MKKSTLLFLMANMIAANADAALPEGSPAPDIKTQASQAGKAFSYSLIDKYRKGPVVVYFYPSAYTNGCNIQAHSFAVHHDEFAAAGASIVGVSQDSIERLNEFSADPDFCAGKFPVASDPDGKIANAYELSIREAQPGKKDSRGVEIDHAFTERTTFVIDASGNIVATIGGLKPEDNVAKALETVKRLAAGRSSGS